MTTNNKLIAEFLGKTNLITENQFLSMEHKAHNPTIIEYLKYDTDWNWLMQVVEKIQLNSKKFGIVTLHGLGRTKIDCYNNEKLSNRIDILDQKYGIAPTYNACIEFIKWYNKQQ